MAFAAIIVVSKNRSYTIYLQFLRAICGLTWSYTEYVTHLHPTVIYP